MLVYFQNTIHESKSRKMGCLHNSQSIKETARQTNVSTATVGRILDTISYPIGKFSNTLSIDEFRGNASTGEFQCILVDPIKHKVLDILPDRKHN